MKRKTYQPPRNAAERIAAIHDAGHGTYLGACPECAELKAQWVEAPVAATPVPRKPRVMTKLTVGGSLLPSSDKRTLAPLGDYLVVPVPQLDTHVLLYKGSTVAEHPNGYSCRELAERMVSGDVDRALQQHECILRCGGMAIHAEHIKNIMGLV